ncbi:MAG: hypothetical protein QXF09_02680 [Nitrososphaerota archaeon]
MNKKYLILGLIVLALIGIIFSWLILTKMEEIKKGTLEEYTYQTTQQTSEYMYTYTYPSEYTYTTQEVLQNVLKGVGFKEGAFSIYKLEGWGVVFIGETEFPKEGYMTLKMVKFSFEGKEHFGFEIEVAEFPITLLQLFDKKTKEPTWYFIKSPKQVVGSPGTGPTIYIELREENLEETYEVDETLTFVGEDVLQIETGKRIKVKKFERVGYGDGVLKEEFWFSEEVPFYLVYYTMTGKSEGVEAKASITLINFALSGARTIFTPEDLEKI